MSKEIIKKVLTSDEYVDECGMVCPVCRSENICTRPNSFNSSFERMSCSVYCEDCNSEWTETYSLSGIKDLNIG